MSDFIHFVCYKSSDGRIISVGYGLDTDLYLQERTDIEAVQIPAPIALGEYRVNTATGSLIPLSPLPEFDTTTVTADDVDAATVTGLPNPTAVTISGDAEDSFTVTSGSLSLTFGTPGRYVVRMDAGVEYKTSETVIYAT